MELLLSLIFLFLFARPVAAISDPLTVPNNRYGIHIADPNDIPDLAPLVNSSGGDWGYVTLVIPKTDQNSDAWQKKFDELRRLHLIPIVRLATTIDGSSWTKPKKDDIRDWVSFLNSLNWPTQNRYVIVFNEPNHANEWGSEIDPEGYADIFVHYADAFKQASPDFFILPAGLDVSAANDGGSLDAAAFWERMITARPELLQKIDGWTSHSYPNPGFSGSPYARGRGTLGSFAWELEYLKQLGLQKQLPVFITETGWNHSEGKFWQPRLASPQTVGSNFQVAAATIWQDPRIAAVTPFVFNYQDYPFDHFSFKKIGNNEYYPHYTAYQSIPKMKGAPRQLESYEIIHPLIPDKLVAGSRYTLHTEIRNTGQVILSEKNAYQLAVNESNGFSLTDVVMPTIEPGQKGELQFTLLVPPSSGQIPVMIGLNHNNRSIPLENRQVTIVPPPNLTLRLRLGWRKTSSAQNVNVLIYQKDTLIHEFSGQTLVDGRISIKGISDIVPGEKYRVVAVVPTYLPRQTVQVIGEGTTTVQMPRFLPLDFDSDGALTWKDVIALLNAPPHAVFSRFFGP